MDIGAVSNMYSSVMQLSQKLSASDYNKIVRAESNAQGVLSMLGGASIGKANSDILSLSADYKAFSMYGSGYAEKLASVVKNYVSGSGEASSDSKYLYSTTGTISANQPQNDIYNYANNVSADLEGAAAYLDTIKKYENMAADETLSQEQRDFALQATESLKKSFDDKVTGIFNRYQGYTSLKGYMGKEAVGLGDIADMTTDEIVSAMGKAIENLDAKKEAITKAAGGTVTETERAPKIPTIKDIADFESAATQGLNGYDKYGAQSLNGYTGAKNEKPSTLDLLA